MSSNSKGSILVNAAKLATLNILLQVGLRASTFIANAVILRYSDKSLLGIINVRLMLFYTTCQFFCREATRRACTSDAKLYKWNVAVNCIWMNFPILFVVGNVLLYVWANVLPLPENEELIASYQQCVSLIWISIFFELLVEPFYIYGHLNGFIKSRVLIEGFTNMSRTFGMVLIVFCESEPKEILALFGSLHLLSSIGYSLLYFLVFYFHFQTSSEDGEVTCLSDFLPSRNHLSDTRKLLAIVGTFFVQTVLKQLLTEGESIVMTFFNLLSFADQGVYHAISNLSSLAARFVFAPIEESSYLVFAQCIDRNQPFERQPKSMLQVVDRVLKQLLRLMLLIGLVIVIFGFNYSELALLLYGGREFASRKAVEVMQYQCFYVAIIALNGVTETFTFAVMSQAELIQFNYLMVALSVLFLASSFLLVPIIGLPGFVLAVSIQMLGRIAFSLNLIRKSFRRASMSITLKELLPRRLVIGYLLVVFIILYALNNVLLQELQPTLVRSAILYIAAGGAQLLVFALLVYLYEGDLVRFFMHELRQIKVD